MMGVVLAWTKYNEVTHYLMAIMFLVDIIFSE